ncbi:MAG: glycosyltransferase family 9 protein [Alphaproteobacteria bacterium]|nr:glycosyltransferase family 9 protein [Alphaproteobacteria bacterium]OJV45806.1 MAG: hypothetical protein BGO28_06270 [Alphaproteobacteria bacterium 43-37]
MKVLFIGCRYIGDAVLSFGVINWLVETIPNLDLTVATPTAPQELYNGIPGLSKVFIEERKKRGLHWWDLWRQVARKRWDLVIDMRGSAIGFMLMTKRRLIWSAKPSSKHRVEDLANMVGAKEALKPKIWVEPQDVDAIQDLPENMILFAPAANWVGKQWPQECFAALFEKLSQQETFKNSKVGIIAALNEREACQSLCDALPKGKFVDLIGRFTLKQLFSVMTYKGLLFVGNDSGLMHMASASGIPVVGLFGPSREENFAPVGPRATYVRTDESYDELVHRIHHFKHEGSLMTNLSVEKVFQACMSHFSPEII